jgi:DNA-binding beta-propeller fold protein YncE
MKRSIGLLLPVLILFALEAQSQVPGPLKLIQDIPLPGLHDGDFDHFVVDLPGQRLFLAAEDNSALEIIDLRTNKLMRTIKGLTMPHSMAYNADLKKLFVADETELKIYDATAFKLLGAIPMKAHADASIYDPASKLYYVGNGGKRDKEDYILISVVDTTSDKKLGDIRLNAGRVEAMAIEKSGPRLFVNLADNDAVAVIDREKRTLITTWSVAQEGRGNAPMAFDEPDHRLFVVTRDPGRVIALDSDTGKIVTSEPCAGMADDAVYDTKSTRLYVAGTPFIRVFQKRTADRYDLLGQVPTAFHAITAILVPELNRYYLAVNHHGDTEAEVQVYSVVP